MISQKKAASNVSAMMEVFTLIGLPRARINEALAKQMEARLFEPSGPSPRFDDLLLEKQVVYLVQLIDITGIRSMADLATYFRQLAAGIRETIQDYQEGDILTRVKMEQRRQSATALPESLQAIRAAAAVAPYFT